ncbi:DUF2796 domain-containing protein [Pseudohalocynthiibacter aestuariivivens]|nr:DUF2796 domain-containing protein [Pseudohalocynthiibacter aestuariivivens]QIE46780.1 DUF2796 domain-containing protein [Pseudohalocynthiibacter aestuariivivens]
MKPFLLALAAVSFSASVSAQETREMDAHVHGVSAVEIAIEHGKVEINLLSPGMDIVGFEYAASSAEDKNTVEAAIRTMLMPENIVSLPEAAGCRLTEVLVHLHSGDHAHEDGHEDEHGDEHDDEHDDAKHSEFHATYAYACDDEDALATVSFPFFENFANAREVEVQYVTETGAGTAELTPKAPELTLE